MPTGLEGFDDDAKGQAEFFVSRGVKVYARLLDTVVRLVAEREPLVRGALLEAWAGRAFHASYERPLLLLASLRQDAMSTPHHPLAGAIGSDSSGDAAISADDVVASFATHAPAREALAHRFVQTNEVTRAIAWRLALGRFPAGKPVHLVDLGCSAGLNLVADRIELGWTGANGGPMPLPKTDAVTARIGLDRSPIDPRRDAERAWLRACLWPGQTDRRRRLDAALEAASAAMTRGEMSLHSRTALAMPEFLEEHAASKAARGAAVLAYQTVLTSYLEPAERAAYLAAMGAWSRGGAEGERLWIELEDAPRDATDGPAELRAHGKGGTLVLGHGEYHPSTIRLDSRAMGELPRL
ncbi:MAG: hypothetical protein JWM74_5581 [Myxococcaceae bacterium]|nr:hypothetical protein [Myxococcaceae bacterium]